MSYGYNTIHESGVIVLVSKPPAYIANRGALDVVVILDAEDKTFFEQCELSARQAHAAVKDKDGRNWHPEMVILGIQAPEVMRSNPQSYEAFVQTALPEICNRFGTKPFAAGRALVARCGPAAALVRSVLAAEKHAVHSLFRFCMLGSVGDGTVGPPVAASALPDKTQAFLFAASAGVDADAARQLQASLLARMTGGTDVTMFVTRDGEQTYTEHERTGPPPVALDLVDPSFAASSAAFAERATVWIGERLEAQKLVSLGSLLPWHEFK